jgi:hypothetical protein
MASTVRSQRMTLNVTVEFEPNRLANDCLASAYELAVPLVSQHVGVEKKVRKVQINDHNQQLKLTVQNG